MARDAISTAPEPELVATEDYEKTLQQPAGHPKRRETLLQRAEEDENDGYEGQQSPVTQDEFEDLLKDPGGLYNEVIELITRNREL